MSEMFAVIYEQDSDIVAIYATDDRQHAHLVWEQAQKLEREVSGSGEVEPGRHTLISCVETPDALYKAIEEGG